MTNYSELAILGVLGLLLSSGAIYIVLRFSQKPNFAGRELEAHHTHQNPIPRLGGIGLAIAFTGGAGWFLACSETSGSQAPIKHLFIVAIAMFGLGLWDDLFSLGAKRKLLGQIFLASCAYFWGIEITTLSNPINHHTIELGFWAWPVTVFWLVATTNLINLIDGVDGLAGGICLMLMVLLVGVGGANGGVAWIAATMAGGLLGFLRFNFPPARIYLGDGGAYFMGFLTGALTIINAQKGTVFAALIAPLFVMALPILDTSLAILRRGLKGLPLFSPDRRHIHHRLLDAGISRRQLVLGAYVFTAFFLFLGFAVCWNEGSHLAILVGIGVVFILIAAGRLNFSREWFSVGSVVGNSLAMRSEVQYVLAQKRWLLLETARAPDLASLNADTAFIAEKIGYAAVRIRMPEGEKVWNFAPTDEHSWTFRQKLPSQPDCFIELTSAAKGAEISPAVSPFRDRNTFIVLSELLANGWIKAHNGWRVRHK